MVAFPTSPGADGSAGWTADPPAARRLRVAAVVYAAAWAIHTGDHLRRGLGVVTLDVSVVGSLAAVLQLVAVGAVLARRPWAAVAAVAIGLPDAIGIAAVHLLPHWSAFSDQFAHKEIGCAQWPTRAKIAQVGVDLPQTSHGHTDTGNSARRSLGIAMESDWTHGLQLAFDAMQSCAQHTGDGAALSLGFKTGIIEQGAHIDDSLADLGKGCREQRNGRGILIGREQ